MQWTEWILPVMGFYSVLVTSHLLIVDEGIKQALKSSTFLLGIFALIGLTAYTMPDIS